MIVLDAEMSEQEWLALPVWPGLDPDDSPGTRYRGEYGGVPYLVTVQSVNGKLQSASQKVVFT